ncbi:MAG: response regulator [Ignavibacteriales bacterium]|nr:response regulator [Ignavibacteriales bacterium]
MCSIGRASASRGQGLRHAGGTAHRCRPGGLARIDRGTAPFSSGDVTVRALGLPGRIRTPPEGNNAVAASRGRARAARVEARNRQPLARRPGPAPARAAAHHRAPRYANFNEPAGNNVSLDRGRTGGEQGHDLVLLVEHDPVRARTVAALAARCWRVVEADGGAEALELFARHRPDIVVPTR